MWNMKKKGKRFLCRLLILITGTVSVGQASASAGAADTEATVCGEASFDPAAADATGDAAKGAPSAAEAVAAGETVKDAPPAAAPPEGDDPFAGLELPPGYRLVEMEGEFVLVLRGAPERSEPVVTAEQALEIVARYRSEGRALKEACKLAAADTGFGKNELYQMALNA